MNPYPAYKESGQPWLGPIPSHWEAKRLKFAATINPSRSDRLQHLSPTSLVTFLPMENVSTDGVVDSSIKRPFEEVRVGYTYFERGDVVVAKITPCFENGKGAYLTELDTQVGFGTTEFIVLRPSQSLLPKFLYNVTKSGPFRKMGTESMTGSAGQQRISPAFVADWVTPLPPPAEQAAIVGYLDRKTADIERFITKKRQLIALLNEQKAAIINQAVTKGLNPDAPMKPSETKLYPPIPNNWKMTRLRHVCTKVADGPHFSPAYVDEGFPFYSARNIKPGEWDFADVKYVSEQNYVEFSRKIEPKRGDVLYTKGGTTGVAKAVDLDYPFQVWVHIAVLKLNHRLILPRFLEYSLNSDACYQQSQLETRGATNKDLGLTRMINIVFGLPSLLEQRQIIDWLDAETGKLTSAIARTEREIELINEYRTTLISDAVTGKIDVREAATE